MQPVQSTTAEARAVGHVSGAVYLFYVGGMGIAMTIVIIISLLAMQARLWEPDILLCIRSSNQWSRPAYDTDYLLVSQASRTGSDLWLAWAAAHPASPSNSLGSSAVSATQLLQGLMGFAAASIVCALVRHLPAVMLVPYDAMHRTLQLMLPRWPGPTVCPCCR